MIVEAMLHGASEGLAQVFSPLGVPDLATVLRQAQMAAPDIGRLLNSQGWFRYATHQVEGALSGMVEAQLARDPGGFGRFVAEVVELCAFRIEAPLPWRYAVVRAVIVPVLKIAATHTAYAGFALLLDQRMCRVILNKEESAENFRRLYAITAPDLTAAGATLGATHPRPSVVKSLSKVQGRPHVAFFLQGDFTAAHAALLWMFLRGLARFDARPFDPDVYVCDGEGQNLDTLREAVDGLGLIVRNPTPASTRSHRECSGFAIRVLPTVSTRLCSSP